MTDSEIRDMVGLRGEQAGIQNVHPHRFRRSFADGWLAAGVSTDDLMHITGWKTYDMVREYTEQRGIPRAHNAHARLSLVTVSENSFGHWEGMATGKYGQREDNHTCRIVVGGNKT
jgi:integrase